MSAPQVLAVLAGALAVVALGTVVLAAMWVRRVRTLARAAAERAQDRAETSSKYWQRQVQQLCIERDAAHQAALKAQAQARAGYRDAEAAADERQRQVLDIIINAAWPPANPYRPPAGADLPQVIEAISATSQALSDQRRAEYIEAHPEYVQGWEPEPAP